MLSSASKVAGGASLTRRTTLPGGLGRSEAAGAGARALGASEQAAERITGAVDLTQGIAGGVASAAAGVARKAAVASLSKSSGVMGDASPAARGAAKTGQAPAVSSQDIAEMRARIGVPKTPGSVSASS